jgi:hypothetical protein
MEKVFPPLAFVRITKEKQEEENKEKTRKKRGS